MSFQLVRAHARVYVLLRLGITLTDKEICLALGDGLRCSAVEHDSVEADVHLFRNQCNRFKTRIALALFNLNDGSSTMFPVLMSAPPIYDAQEIEEYRQKSAEMIEIDGRTLSRYDWTQEQRKIETAIRAQKDISNLARAAGLTDEARKASAKIDRLYDRYDQISAAAGLEKQYSRAYVRGYRQTKAGTINTAANNQSTYVKPKIKTSGMTQKILAKTRRKAYN